MDEVVALCKRRGLIFPASEIYGGIANTYDYGHYGVLLKRNVTDAWWRAMIQERDDIVALLVTTAGLVALRCASMVMWPFTPRMRETSSTWKPLITEVTTIRVATPRAIPTREKVAMMETKRSPLRARR